MSVTEPLGVLLQRAVEQNDLKRVKEILNLQPNSGNGGRGQLLHKTSNAEIAKELLLHGAYVDTKNDYRESPLLTAVKGRKGLKMVHVLLKHNADVNIQDRKGSTPLNCAVRPPNFDWDVVQELLLYGADINIKNRKYYKLYENETSPLDIAVECYCGLTVAKLLVKIALIKNFDKDFRRIIVLDKEWKSLQQYLEECICEVLKMKTDEINGTSLYKFLLTESTNTEISHISKIKLSSENIIAKYPIYYDLILRKVKLYSNVLNKLSVTKVYTILESSGDNIEENKVVLNFDCVCAIAEYLNVGDLYNLITAFCKDAGKFYDYSETLFEVLEEEEVLEGSAKRAKLF